VLLDRDVEIAALDRGLAAARAGAGSVLWLEGEAGAGKTRLLAALRVRAREQGAHVLAARGGPLEQGYAWGAVRQLLEPLLVAADEAERARLTAGVAALAVAALHPADGPVVDDQATMHGLYWLVVNLADSAPVVLVVDDLHWVDVVSLRWLSYLVRRAQDLPLLIALSTRPESRPEAADVLDALADDPLTRPLRPRPLGPAAVTELTAEALGTAPEPDFAQEVGRVTGGNPFYVGALLREARDAGLRGAAHEAARLLALGPDSVGRTVLRRIGALEDGLQVARALAALEEPATPEAVALVADRDPGHTRVVAEQLMTIGILDERLPLDFTHPIVRHAVLEGVPLAERPTLNARAAAALARQGAGAERIAARLVHVPAHTPLPAPLGDATVHLRAAAEAALGRGAPDAALTYARRALQEGASVELDLLAARAHALEHAPGWEERWASVVARMPDPDLRARARLQVVGGLISTGEFERATALAREALAEATDPDLRVALEMNALQAGLMHPDHAAETRQRVRALIDAEAGGAPLTLYERAIVAFALMLWGEDAARAGALAQQLVADPALFAPGDASVAYITMTTLLFTGRYPPVLPALDALCAFAAQTGSRAMLLGGVSGRGLARWGMGDLLAAEADADAVLALFDDIAPSAFDPYHLTTVAYVLTERGQAQRALELIAQRAEPEPWPASFQYASLHSARAAARLATGDAEGALAGALAAGAIADALALGPIFEWRLTAAHAQLRLGRSAEAQTLAAAQLALAERAGLSRWTGTAQATLGLARADLDLLAAAVTTLRDVPVELTRAELFHGGALRRANQRSAALEVLRRAAERAHRHGLTLLADALAEELRVAGARPRRTLADGVEALTAAERRVIDVAISGLTNRQIAQTLFLTQKTVETHLSNAYRKLDIAKRSELAAAMSAT
jgi:DNA-binding CsgD family transcriptional regulator